MLLRPALASLLLLAASLAPGSAGAAEEPRNCSWTYRISGPRADGQGTWDKELTVTQRCYDMDDAARNAQLASDKGDYAGFDYRLIGPPSLRQDCAGYTFQRLFGHGPFWIDAANFADGVIFWFGKPVFKPGLHQATWGDVRAGDVIVYRSDEKGKAMHIAYVRSVETTAGVVSKILVETKDGKQAAYLHPIGFTESVNDPLTRRMGGIHIYRVDTSKVRADLLSRTCECPEVDPVTGQAKASKPAAEEVDSGPAPDLKDVTPVEGKLPPPATKAETWDGLWRGQLRAEAYVGDLPPEKRFSDDEARVEDLGKAVRFTRTKEGKSLVLRKTASNPNAALFKKQWKTPAANGLAGETETRTAMVLFVREGRLYLAERVEIDGLAILDLGTEKKEIRTRIRTEAIGILDPAK